MEYQTEKLNAGFWKRSKKKYETSRKNEYLGTLSLCDGRFERRSFH